MSGARNEVITGDLGVPGSAGAMHKKKAAPKDGPKFLRRGCLKGRSLVQRSTLGGKYVLTRL